MPAYTVELLQNCLNQIQMPMKGTRIGVLGVAYKANVDDTRESPAFKIIQAINDHGVKCRVYDPHVPEHSTEKSLKELLEKSIAVVVVTDHKEFKNIDISLFKQCGVKIVVDGKNCLDKDKINKLGIIYKGIGR